MNRIRCAKCRDLLHSKYRHDFQQCKCSAVFVDGGDDYCRMGGETEDIIIVADDGTETPCRPAEPKASELTGVSNRIARVILREELIPARCLDSGEAAWNVGEVERLAHAIASELDLDNKDFRAENAQLRELARELRDALQAETSDLPQPCMNDCTKQALAHYDTVMS